MNWPDQRTSLLFKQLKEDNMATTISKNEDGTYKLSSDTTSEENLTKEQIEDRIATYKANIEAKQISKQIKQRLML